MGKVLLVRLSAGAARVRLRGAPHLTIQKDGR